MMSQTSTRILTFLAPPLPYFIESNRVCYHPGAEHPNRSNLGVFDLLFVHSGTLHVAEERRSWSLGPGQMLILRPDRWHYSPKPCDETTVFDWVHFQTAGEWEESDYVNSGTLHGDYYVYAIRLPKFLQLAYPEQAKEILAKMHEAAHASSHASFWERQQLFLHLIEMLDEGWRNDSAPTSVGVAERAAAFMKMNYRNPVTNKELGQGLGLHPNYIARCMVEVYGCTPQQYMLLYRLDQAKLLLLKTDWPIARIASETGFRQTPHFSRCFSERTGLSPLQYRKQYTRDGS
ncbi:helix-turn-helix domain-containing protein [Paenibacillus tarimensis]|uniref:helix-turn-helix transcriptional regulator n=2 Tax=Paenibacillus tarimensis TaxID=416012 RepID=UPI0039EE87C4|nr:AraC family transcriptional regulator [Paenibacillus tarimensis]